MDDDPNGTVPPRLSVSVIEFADRAGRRISTQETLPLLPIGSAVPVVYLADKPHVVQVMARRWVNLLLIGFGLTVGLLLLGLATLSLIAVATGMVR
jgi:hypothetical protein